MSYRGGRRRRRDCGPPAVAIDCEMVGCGPRGSVSKLARVAVVDENGRTVVDEFVRPDERVTDYRTFVTGITPQMLRTRGISFEAAREVVREATRGKVIVGHGLHNDLRALELDVPESMCRDTQKYTPLHWPIDGVSRVPDAKVSHPVPSLKSLTYMHFGERIQEGSHDPREDALATMRLYDMVKDDWNRHYEAYDD